jgi:hypothetical protein
MVQRSRTSLPEWTRLFGSRGKTFTREIGLEALRLNARPMAPVAEHDEVRSFLDKNRVCGRRSEASLITQGNERIDPGRAAGR